jgi:Amt family ammonium transporter
MQCVSIACLVSLLWFAAGYSLAFDPGNGFIGGLGKAFLAGVTRESVSGATPEMAFFMFQMTFAIITPALIIGAFVERVKFAAVMVFTALWLLIVYAPVAHWVWGGGWAQKAGALDFAGGIVVHATAGISALLFAHFVGPRDGFPRELEPPHNPGMTMMGAGMLWVGWYGFNGGSALAADGNAAMAIAVTHLSASAAGLTWAGIEWAKFGRPSLMGAVTGVVAGLATITPASGYVGPIGAILLGAGAGALCLFAVQAIKHRFKIDDSLDVFAVHGVGGILGSLLVAFFASQKLGGVGYPVTGGLWAQVGVQALAVSAALLWAGVGTQLILMATKALVGLRAADTVIQDGLDLAEHGERATPA